MILILYELLDYIPLRLFVTFVFILEQPILTKTNISSVRTTLSRHTMVRALLQDDSLAANLSNALAGFIHHQDTSEVNQISDSSSALNQRASPSGNNQLFQPGGTLST